MHFNEFENCISNLSSSFSMHFVSSYSHEDINRRTFSGTPGGSFFLDILV